MRRWKLGLALMGASLLAASPAGAQEEAVKADESGEAILNVGDPAPPLVVSGWVRVKGDKIERLEKDGTYVVEFWATWCGPCRASIPHLTELAHEYRDEGVRFIGVDVWESDRDAVRPFVEKEMGDKMDYDVALDEVPEGADPNEGVMAKTWMRAAGENGIPTAFIVKGGTIAWIGHPMGLDEPLAKVVAGDWDPKAHAAERLAQKAKERKFEATMQRVYEPFRAKDYKGTLSAVEAVVGEYPELENQFTFIKFQALCGAGEVDAALAAGRKLAEGGAEDAMSLNNIAWYAIDPDREGEPDARLVTFALETARRANELSKGEDPMVLDTYAWALFRSGRAAEAVEAEEKAIALFEAQDPPANHPYRAQFRDRLEKYRDAAK